MTPYVLLQFVPNKKTSYSQVECDLRLGSESTIKPPGS